MARFPKLGAIGVRPPRQNSTGFARIDRFAVPVFATKQMKDATEIRDFTIQTTDETMRAIPPAASGEGDVSPRDDEQPIDPGPRRFEATKPHSRNNHWRTST